MSSKEPVYCLCGQPYDPERFMIQCDVCKDWFHGSCTGVKEHDAGDIIKYHCPNCQIAHGPSKWKVRTNWHRHDYSDPAADEKKVQAGTHVFIQELKNRRFHSGLDVTTCLPAHELTLEYLDNTAFMNPLLIADKEGLGLMLPPSDLSVGDVVDFIGADYLIDVIDVLKQESIKMTLAEFADYYTSYNRTKVFNVVSLEFSDTKLSDFVRPPELVSQISWVEQCWPRSVEAVGEYRRPAVMKYCLMGTENSYTDFHIDFGGSSVWYHVLRGEKMFYLIRPTEENLVKYERWMAAADQSEIFLGDEVDACFRLALRAGETLFIPTGWIHAVLTTTDSMVFGGNFLHSYNIGLQLSVYEMEQRLNCPSKFMFPSFETTNWFAAARVVEQLRESSRPPPPYLVNGAKALLGELRRWACEAEQPNGHSRTEAVPAQINVPSIIKELAKEVKGAEKKWGKKRGRKNLLGGSAGRVRSHQAQALRVVKVQNVTPPDTGMYDFSSSDDDHGTSVGAASGLLMGGKRKGTASLAASLPSISSFSNYHQSKKKEAKFNERKTLASIAASASTTSPPPPATPPSAMTVVGNNNSSSSSSPKKGAAAQKPKGGKASKAAKAAPNTSKAPQKAAKAPKQPKAAAKQPVMTATTAPPPPPPKTAKKPKKIKAEPKGGLKLRLSIGGAAVGGDDLPLGAGLAEAEDGVGLTSMGGMHGTISSGVETPEFTAIPRGGHPSFGDPLGAPTTPAAAAAHAATTTPLLGTTAGTLTARTPGTTATTRTPPVKTAAEVAAADAAVDDTITTVIQASAAAAAAAMTETQATSVADPASGAATTTTTTTTTGSGRKKLSASARGEGGGGGGGRSRAGGGSSSRRGGGATRGGARGGGGIAKAGSGPGAAITTATAAGSGRKRQKRPTPVQLAQAVAAAAQAAAAVADQAVAAEVEVQLDGEDDDDVNGDHEDNANNDDAYAADPDRLTVVIPGETADEIEAIAGSSPRPEQEAIQGMLSMSGTFSFSGGDQGDDLRRSRTAGNLERLKQRLAAKRGLVPPGGGPIGRDGAPVGAGAGVMGHQRDEEDEFERALRNCRQDEDFIYLGIDANDDDDNCRALKKRGKIGPGRPPTGVADQTWSPKGVSLKGLNAAGQRPQREGVKRDVMESTLAESTKYEPPTTASKDPKAPKPGIPRDIKKDPTATALKPKKPAVQKIKSESKDFTEPKVRRTGKKGMATAKQRLGKILKIHRMIH